MTTPDETAAPRTRVLVWMCVIIGVNQLGFGALIPVLPLYAQSFGVSVSAIGTTIAAYGLARLVLAIPSGRLSDRFGRRPTLAAGGAASALGSLWCGLAGSFPEFLAARFVAGAGAAKAPEASVAARRTAQASRMPVGAREKGTGFFTGGPPRFGRGRPAARRPADGTGTRRPPGRLDCGLSKGTIPPSRAAGAGR